MSAYLNALREEGSREDLLREVERQKARADAAEVECRRLREALRLSPCPSPISNASTVGECIQTGNCDCHNRTALDGTS